MFQQEKNKFKKKKKRNLHIRIFYIAQNLVNRDEISNNSYMCGVLVFISNQFCI